MSRSDKVAAFAVLGIIGIVAVIATIVLATAKNEGKPSFLSAAGVGGTAAATSFSASVTMTVTLGKYGSCGSGGYSDIRAGGQVEIVNQKHEVLALGTLTKSSTGTCEFKASVKDIPVGEKMYGAKLGNANRGVIWKNENDARALGWALTLGDD
jgi:hypothetical protein